jgi:hypothetical protein
MNSTEQALTPVAVALHTRDRQDDYHWLFESGPAQLTDRLKELHRGLIADQESEPTTFVLLDQGERLALLVANLKTSRCDHVRTRIDDTLLLEFEARDRESVLRAAAGLLGPPAGEIKQGLLEFAEARYKEHRERGSTAPASLTTRLPSLESRQAVTVPLSYRHVGLRFDADNQNRVADLLLDRASTKHPPAGPFVVVATGFVGKEILRQHAKPTEHFIALTRSSSFTPGQETSLDADQAKRKHSIRLVLIVLSILLVVFVLLMLVVGWLNKAQT